MHQQEKILNLFIGLYPPFSFWLNDFDRLISIGMWTYFVDIYDEFGKLVLRFLILVL